MTNPPEIVTTTKRRVYCDGATDIRAGAALGHPRVYLEIDQKGYVECGYCDRRFVLEGAEAHQRDRIELEPGDNNEFGASASTSSNP